MRNGIGGLENSRGREVEVGGGEGVGVGRVGVGRVGVRGSGRLGPGLPRGRLSP